MVGITSLLLIVLMLIPNTLRAEVYEVMQTIKVSGTVLDELGQPVIGATVRVKMIRH